MLIGATRRNPKMEKIAKNGRPYMEEKPFRVQKIIHGSQDALLFAKIFFPNLQKAIRRKVSGI